MSHLSRQLTEQLSSPQTRRERHLETLIQVSRAIGSIRDLNKLMSAIMRHVTDSFAADRSTLFLHDPVTHELWSHVAQGLEDWPRELRIADDAGMCGRVFQSHESLLIHDTAECTCFDRNTAFSTGYMPRSALVVPVFKGAANCAGVLQVLCDEVDYFTEDDLTLLEAIAVQVGISLENAGLHDAQKRQFESFVRAFSAALDARDTTTAIHSVNVANYAMGIGHELGLDAKEIRWLRIAGLLHDVGKIGVPEDVLVKPGRLTDAEYDAMKTHAAYSRKILAEIEFTEDLEGMDYVAAAHHERLDGSGYPDGLTAEQLPLRARILAVADVFDALTQDRHYRPGMPLDRAMRIIDDQVPHQLDTDCVAALKRFLGIV